MNVYELVTNQGELPFDVQIQEDQGNFAVFLDQLREDTEQDIQIVLKKLGELLSVRWNMKFHFGGGTTNLQASGENMILLNMFSSEINSQLQAYQLLFMRSFEVAVEDPEQIRSLGLAIADALDTAISNKEFGNEPSNTEIGAFFLKLFLRELGKELPM